ncbi:hypothetical protein F5Y15DRAFT_284274 [Xylariaceae sp. FL0016]|nr:hypothetical protein F5Y15DRAFT_284274 [Xylariaceae sp. FL0016]
MPEMWSFGTTMTIAKDTDPPPNAAKSPRPSSQPSQDPIPQPQPAASAPRPSILSQRSLKQLGLFFGGASFLALATLVTRRSITRKRRATIPKFYTPSNLPANKIESDGSFIALEALSLATLNVCGFAIMMTGGISWAFDMSNMEDLRSKAQRHMYPTDAKLSAEEERQVEEWVTKMLGREILAEKQGQDPSPPPKKHD